MTKKTNILIFPAGEMISLELHTALSSCVNFEVYGASSVDRHGSYVFKNYTSGLPLITHKNFITELNLLIKKNKIDFIFPTHDDVVLYFGKNQNKINAKVINCDSRTAEILRDKKLIYSLFKDEEFCPEIFEQIDAFPVFIKPRAGQGGVGAKLIKTKNEIPQDINIEDYVICEYLPNEEYSVDCLTDKNGEIKITLPRIRKRTMAGICTCGENMPLTDEIERIAKKINDKLNFCGLWFFQVKKDKNNKFKLLEIASRCASTMCLTRTKGINLPLLSLYCAMGKDVEIINNPYNVKMDRALINRYEIDYDYETVYLDFDDTLIMDNIVNLNLIRYVYQLQNLNKKTILITKHADNIQKTLKKHAISEDLFSQIISLNMDDSKSKYINPEKAIFIDNCFKERDEVSNKFNIPVFDVDTVEVLLDWRY